MNKNAVMANILLTPSSRETIEEIKKVYKTGSVANSITKALSFIRENDPNLHRLKEK